MSCLSNIRFENGKFWPALMRGVMEEKIYIEILDEGSSCFREVPATKLSANTYLVHGEDLHDPDDEEWEFLPGTIVRVEEKILRNADGSPSGNLVAVEALSHQSD